MKKILQVVVMICIYIMAGGCVAEPDPPLEGLDYTLDKLKTENVERVYSIYSMLSSYAFSSENTSLIGYIIEMTKEVNFVEALTVDNWESKVGSGTKDLRFFLKDQNSIILELTESGYLYLLYCEMSEDYQENVVYLFKSDKDDKNNFVNTFVRMGAPGMGEPYFKDNVIEIGLGNPQLSEGNERYLIEMYIKQFADLARYYKEAYKFSGSVVGYYGTYGSYYAVMMEGADIQFTEGETAETVDGVDFIYPNSNRIYLAADRFYTLREAFDKQIINHDDLLKIKKKYTKINNSKLSYSKNENSWVTVGNESLPLSGISEEQVFSIIDSLDWSYIYDKNTGQSTIEFTDTQNRLTVSSLRTAAENSNLTLHEVGDSILLTYYIYDDGLIIMAYTALSTCIHNLYAYLSANQMNEIKNLII